MSISTTAENTAEGGPPSPPEARGANGDPAGALESLYRRYAGAVFRFALRCTGRRDLAEDLTSEAFLALHRNLDSVDQSQLPSWLFRVVKNRAIDHWRRQETERRYAHLAADPEPPEDAPPDASAVVAALHSRALKPVHRICLVLRYVHGMTRAEVAQRTGLNETQVKGHLQYGLDLLRRHFEGQPDEAL